MPQSVEAGIRGSSYLPQIRISTRIRTDMLCKKAKLQAGIKPTALCSAIDKENSIEFPLDLLHYIYNYCCGYASCLLQSSCPSANFFVTYCDCDSLRCDHFYDCCHIFCNSVTCHVIFPALYLSKKRKEKKRKRNIK